MRASVVFASLLAAVLLGLACGPRTTESRRLTTQSSVLSAEEIERSSFVDLYSAISSLRPRWLSRRGPTSINLEDELAIYMDRMRLGGPETLRTIEISAVSSVEYLTPSQAQAKFGMGHPQGAIVVHTRT